MAKPSEISSDDDITGSFKSLSMHNEPGASTQTTNPTQNSTQSSSSTQNSTQGTPPTTQKSTQITVPTQSTPPAANSTRPPPKNPTRNPLPTFPVPQPPICGKCHNPCTRRIVSASNRNNNADRPFYICRVCKNDETIPGSYLTKGWISWDDNVGVRDTNRACYCGVACRQDRAGVESRYPGSGFWTCAYGKCDFLSYRKDSLTAREAREEGLNPFDDAFVP